MPTADNHYGTVRSPTSVSGWWGYFWRHASRATLSTRVAGGLGLLLCDEFLDCVGWKRLPHPPGVAHKWVGWCKCDLLRQLWAVANVEGHHLLPQRRGGC